MTADKSQALKGRPARQGRSQNTFDSILSSAVQIFRDSGPTQLTFVILARQTNVSVGAIQFHFTNKDLLLRAVISYILDENSRAEEAILQELVKKSSSVEEYIQNYIKDFSELMGKFHSGFMRSIEIIAQDETLSKKGKETGIRAETVSKNALREIMMQNNVTVFEDRIDAVYHIIFSFILRELSFPSAPKGSETSANRRLALEEMCVRYLLDGSH